MDILWSLLTLPYAPVRGLTAVVKVIAREAEAKLYDPANIRRELEELDRAEEAGDITAEERDLGQQQVLNRLTGGGGGIGGAAPAAGSGTAQGAGSARSDRPDRAEGRPVRAGQRRGAVQRRRADGRGDPARRRGR